MGRELVDWCDSIPRKQIRPMSRDVLRAMCRMTSEDRCIFYMHPEDLLELLPNINSLSALRNHISWLSGHGFLTRSHRGGGSSTYHEWHPDGTRLGRRSVTHWVINAEGITPVYPLQGRLSLLTLYRTQPKEGAVESWDRPQSAGLAVGSVRKADTTLIEQEPEVSEKRTLPPSQVARNVRQTDTSPGGQEQEVSDRRTQDRGEVSEKRTLPRVLGGYKKGILNSMHAGMLEEWTELFIGQCTRRSGLTGLRQLHLQERPRSRNEPIPSVYDSVTAYIEREGRAPPDDIAGWLADEMHYTLKFDQNWQDGGHNSATRLTSFISVVVARHLERKELGELHFDPTKGTPETSGHRYQPVESSAVQPIRRSL